MRSKKDILTELESCKELKNKYQDEGDDYLATIYNHMILTLIWVLGE